MKKLLITTICILAVLTFASCSNNNSNDLSSDKSLSQESSSYENEETKSSNSSASDKYNVKNKDIEKVFLSIYGNESESDYDTDAEKLIEEIKNCKDVPGSTLVEKIGKISIKDKNSDSIVDVAELYIAADYSVYAVYIDNSDKNYAYKIDTSLFE